MKKRLLSILLIICLCAALLPTFAAAGTQDSSADNPYILTQASFDNATTDSSPVKIYFGNCYTLADGYYKLTENITLSTYGIGILGNGNITLDLNGHVLKRDSGTLLQLSSSGTTFTLTDSSAAGDGALVGDSVFTVGGQSGSNITIYANGGSAIGSFELYGVTIQHTDGKPVTVFYGDYVTSYAQPTSIECCVIYGSDWDTNGMTTVTFKNGDETHATAYVKGTDKLYLPPKDDPKKDDSIFTGWYAEGSDEAWDFKNDTIHDGLTLTAGWVSSTHSVDFDSNGGSAVTNTGTVAHGSKLTAPAEPTREGYKFGGWFKDLNFENKWNFDEDTVTADITLTAKWEKIEEIPEDPDDKPEEPETDGIGGLIAILDDMPFVDVNANHYFYDSVKWAYHAGVTGGTDAWHFSPDDGCTRAQIVTFLWRAAGCPSATYLGNFTDVNADAYYATAVAWAVENGITNGTSATTFSPEAVCTRADAVTFLYRAFGRNPNYTANFSDVPANAYYADAVAWAAENNITGGTGNGKFSPNDTCSRAQIVTFLYRTLG